MVPARRVVEMESLREKARHYSARWRRERPGLLAQMWDREHRFRKADKIATILTEAGLLPDDRALMLDIGCSSGLILERLSPGIGLGVGLDLDADGLQCVAPNLRFVRGDGEHLPFHAGCFDLVLCNHVYEHTPDPARLIGEIHRVLKPDGVCYFCGPNRYDLIEPHYGLPLLGWLPPGLADRYVRLAGRGAGYPERPLSRRGLFALLERFAIEEWTLKVMAHPERYHIGEMLPPGSFKQRLALWVGRRLPFLLPDAILLLRKRPGS